MGWLSILSALLAATRALADWLNTRQLLDAGAAQAIIKGTKESDDAITRARAARELVRSNIARGGDSELQRDDGFKRKD